MVASVYYKSILEKSAKALADKYQETLHQRILVYSNTSHSSHQTRAILWEFLWEFLRYLIYNKDFVLSDFFFFSKLQKKLSTHSSSVKNVKIITLGADAMS